VPRQQRVVIHRDNGPAEETVFGGLPDAGFAARIAELKGRAEADVPDVIARFVTVSCDGLLCSAAVQVDWDDPRLPPGWTSRPDGDDFCPRCSGGAN
jgi:hypothetical protein